MNQEILSLVNVNNVPNKTNKYIVASNVDGELWYWGSWNNKDEALRTAKEIHGIVLEGYIP